jgi:Flp pilus assembly protein protease CpaA
MTNPVFILALRIGLSILLIALAICDLRRGRVPNWIVWPLMVAAILLTILRLAGESLSLNQIGLIVVVWIACFVAWQWHVFGGGDMKLMIALMTLFPEIGMLLMILLSLLVGLIAALLWRDGMKGLRRQMAILFLAAQGQLPSQTEISEAYALRSIRITFALSLGGLIYLWLFL